MPWQFLVKREDSPLRHHLSATGIKESNKMLHVDDLPEINALKLDTWYWEASGATHADLHQLRNYMRTLISLFKRDPLFFLKISEEFEGLAKEWLHFMENIAHKDLSPLSDEKLLTLFKKFCKYEIEFSACLMPPFAVDRIYETDYKKLLGKICKSIKTNLSDLNFHSDNSFLTFLFRTLIKKSDENKLVDIIKEIIEFSEKKTFTEMKDLHLLKLAEEIDSREDIQNALKSTTHISEEWLEKVAPEITEKIKKCVNEYTWLKSWGYPFSNLFSFQEFVDQINEKISQEPSVEISKIEYKHKIYPQILESLLELIPLSQDEISLIRTIKEYLFLRTWRMEVIVKANYLSLSLLLETEKRGISRKKMKKGDIFLMIYPEIVNFLKNQDVPRDLALRRDNWGMTMTNGDTEVLAGTSLEEFREEFYSILDFRERGRGIHSTDASFVGGKAEELFRLVQSGIVIPKFFVVTTYAFGIFTRKNGLIEKINEIWNQFDVRELVMRLYEEELSFEETKKIIARLDQFESSVKKLFLDALIPEGLEKTVTKAFSDLRLRETAVRSSAILEDSPQRSWAGRFNSFVYVQENELMRRLKEVWASLFNRISVQYAIENNVNLLSQKMAVIVQEMIDPIASGVVNTTLSTESPGLIEMEAVLGQCSPMVLGQVTPDRYLVDKNTFSIVQKVVSEQPKQFTRKGWEQLDLRRATEQKINDKVIIELAEVAARIEENFEKPQDIEWVCKDNKIIIVQTRPQTGLITLPIPSKDEKMEGDLILTGLRGKVSAFVEGVAKVIRNFEDGAKLQEGDIAVVSAVTPKWDPILIRARAIISDEGGATCHAIRVANERKTPAVVGTGRATNVIRDNETLIVDTREPFRGKIYRIRKDN